MAEAAAVEQHRFFCHCCKGEVSPKLPEYICPRCESGFIEEVTDDSSFLEGGASGISDEAATHFAEPKKDRRVHRLNYINTRIPEVYEKWIPGHAAGSLLTDPPTETAEVNLDNEVRAITEVNLDEDEGSTLEKENRSPSRKKHPVKHKNNAPAPGLKEKNGTVWTQQEFGRHPASESATRMFFNETAGLTELAKLWHLLFVDRPFSMDPDRDLTERQPLPSSEYWTSGRTTRLQTQRRYRSRGTTRPDRSPAVEGIVQQFLASLFANSGVPGSPPLSWTGMLHSNPGDYAWGQGGLDAVITQLLGQFENTGPPPAEKEKISSLPTVHVSQDQVDSGLECPVCKEDYRQGEEVRQLPCNHFFHSTCIVPWLEMHDTCPVCRKSLSGEDSTRQSLDATSLNSEGRPQERWSF